MQTISIINKKNYQLIHIMNDTQVTAILSTKVVKVNDEYAWYALARGEDYVKEIARIAAIIDPETGKCCENRPIESNDTKESVSLNNNSSIDAAIAEARQAALNEIIPWVVTRVSSYYTQEGLAELSTNLQNLISNPDNELFEEI